MMMPVIAALFLIVQTGTGSIEGTIVSTTTNRPISGAQVTAARTRGIPAGNGAASGSVVTGGVTMGPGRQINPSVTADSTGHFILDQLEAGTYLVRVVAEGYAGQPFGPSAAGQTGGYAQITLAEGQAMRGMVFRLAPTGNVSGRVTGSSGQPLTGIEVAVLKLLHDIDGNRFQQTAAVQTDDRGDYRLFWVPPGRYYLSAGSASRPMPGRTPFLGQATNKYARTFYPSTVDPSTAMAIEIQPGGEVNGMDFRLNEQTTYRIRGRVVDSVTGQIPRNANISIMPRNPVVVSGSSGSSSGYNNTDGTFELRDVASGSYWISAQLPLATRPDPGGPPPRPPVAIASVEVANADADGVVLTVFPPASVPGRIRVDGHDAVPRLEAVAVVLRPPSINSGFSRPALPGRSNAEGMFTIEEVVPGDYRVDVIGVPAMDPQAGMYIKAVRFGAVDVLSQLLTISGPVSDHLEIILGQNAGRISGTVFNSQSQPAPAVAVVLIPDKRDRRDLYKLTVTAANGQFELTTIAPGSYRIFATGDLESTALFDPEMIRRFETNATAVSVGESANITIDLKLAVLPR